MFLDPHNGFSLPLPESTVRSLPLVFFQRKVVYLAPVVFFPLAYFLLCGFPPSRFHFRSTHPPPFLATLFSQCHFHFSCSPPFPRLRGEPFAVFLAYFFFVVAFPLFFLLGVRIVDFSGGVLFFYYLRLPLSLGKGSPPFRFCPLVLLDAGHLFPPL